MRKIFLTFVSIAMVAAVTSYCFANEQTSLKNAEYYFNRGNAHYEAKNYKKAIANFNKAIEMDPKMLHGQAYMLRGNSYHKLGKLQKAIKDYSRAIKLNPNNTRAYTNRGGALASTGNYQAAQSDWQTVIQIAPNSKHAEMARSNLRKISQKTGKDEQIRPQTTDTPVNAGTAGEGTVMLSGEQTKKGQRYSAKLDSETVIVDEAGTIYMVLGKFSRFWINKKQGNQETPLYEFYNKKDAVGKPIGKGTYVVYPGILNGEEYGWVTVHIQKGVTPEEFSEQKKRRSRKQSKTSTPKPPDLPGDVPKEPPDEADDTEDSSDDKIKMTEKDRKRLTHLITKGSLGGLNDILANANKRMRKRIKEIGEADIIPYDGPEGDSGNYVYICGDNEDEIASILLPDGTFVKQHHATPKRKKGHKYQEFVVDDWMSIFGMASVDRDVPIDIKIYKKEGDGYKLYRHFTGKELEEGPETYDLVFAPGTYIFTWEDDNNDSPFMMSWGDMEDEHKKWSNGDWVEWNE